MSTFDIGTYDYEDICQYTFDNSTETSLNLLSIPYDDSRCQCLEEKLLYGYSGSVNYIYIAGHYVILEIFTGNRYYFETCAKELF